MHDAAGQPVNLHQDADGQAFTIIGPSGPQSFGLMGVLACGGGRFVSTLPDDRALQRLTMHLTRPTGDEHPSLHDAEHDTKPTRPPTPRAP